MGLDFSKEWGHLALGGLVSSADILLTLYKYISNRRNQWIISSVIEDVEEEDKKFQTAIIAIFSNPDKKFDTKANKITIHLLHTNRFRFAEMRFDLSEAIDRKDICCNRNIRLFYVIADTKPIPFITSLRATHMSPNDHIFLEGIETWDFVTNRRLYYSVQQKIRGGIPIRETNQWYVKPQTLRLWSKFNLCLSFENPWVYEFGKEFNPIKDTEKTKSLFDEDINAVIIPSQLDWFESLVFYWLLFSLIFSFNTLFLVIRLEEWIPIHRFVQIGTSVLLSGAIALITTEIFGYIFFNFVKSNYENKDSLQSKANQIKNRTINIWSVVRTVYLLGIAIVSCALMFATHMTLVLTQENERITKAYNVLWFEDQPINEFLFLLLIFTGSVFLTFSVWLLVLGLIRYLFHLCSFTPKTSPKESGSSDGRDASEEAVVSRSKTSNQSKNSKNVEKNVISNMNKLDKDLTDEKQKQKLLTTSVIHSPTKSKGFITPEESRVQTNDSKSPEKEKKLPKLKEDLSQE